MKTNKPKHWYTASACYAPDVACPPWVRLMPPTRSYAEAVSAARKANKAGHPARVCDETGTQVYQRTRDLG